MATGVRPGGTVVFTSFTEQAFPPLAQQLMADLQEAGVDTASRPMASQRLKNPDTCREMTAEAGLVDIEQHTEQAGYHLRQADDWWQVVWNSAMRGRVEQVAAEEREEFRRRDLERLSALQTEDGVWDGGGGDREPRQAASLPGNPIGRPGLLDGRPVKPGADVWICWGFAGPALAFGQGRHIPVPRHATRRYSLPGC